MKIIYARLAAGAAGVILPAVLAAGAMASPCHPGTGQPGTTTHHHQHHPACSHGSDGTLSHRIPRRLLALAPPPHTDTGNGGKGRAAGGTVAAAAPAAGGSGGGGNGGAEATAGRRQGGTAAVLGGSLISVSLPGAVNLPVSVLSSGSGNGSATGTGGRRQWRWRVADLAHRAQLGQPAHLRRQHQCGNGGASTSGGRPATAGPASGSLISATLPSSLNIPVSVLSTGSGNGTATSGTSPRHHQRQRGRR